MKRIITLLFVIVSFSAQAQWDCYNWMSFESTDTLYPVAITIDTVNYHNNKWQIGRPQKAIFDSSHSLYNAIVTDTVAAYPQNDTSVFMIKVPRRLHLGAGIQPLDRFAFFYKLNVDSGSNAIFEISEDSGFHWLNTVDSFSSKYVWSGSAPNFSTSASSWKFAEFSTPLSWTIASYDTLLFRFTFISDTTTSSQEGWMIDDIKIDYWCEGAASDIKNDNLISIYPNPTNGNLHISKATPYAATSTVAIYNTLGQEVYKTDKVPPDGKLRLQLPDGVYVLKYVAGDEYCVKRILIAN